MSDVTVRATTTDDLPTIKAIYDQQVLTGIATFDLVPPPLSSWQERLAGPDHMLTAVDEAGTVLGAAFSSTYRPRPAYDRSREVSVYLDATARGRGVGRRLYDALLARLRADGAHVALAVIAQPNPASEALHRSCGFERVGLLPQVGRKFDRWIDTALWALVLDDSAPSTGQNGASRP